MANIKKEFSDKDFRCKRCNSHLADERLDRQVLVFDNVALYNFCVISCLFCESINTWQSPKLTDKQDSIDRRFPDSLRDVPKPDKGRAAMMAKSVRIAEKRPNYGIHQHKCGKFVVAVGGYIGSYETHDEAVKVRDVALAKNLGYKPKDKQTDTQPQNQFSAS